MKQKIKEAQNLNQVSIFIEGDLQLDDLIWLSDNNLYYHRSKAIFPFVNHGYVIVLDLSKYLKAIEKSTDYNVFKFFENGQQTFKFLGKLSDELIFWMQFNKYYWRIVDETREESKHILISKNEN